MLCMQQCIDMCELTDEEALALPRNPRLHDIFALKVTSERMDGVRSAVPRVANKLANRGEPT